jgi:hydrogenase/urease accessory protein HupE
MINLNSFKKAACSISISIAPMLLSSTALAHTGHSHAQHDTLSGILHALTTHPLIFAVVGLALISAAYISRH